MKSGPQRGRRCGYMLRSIRLALFGTLFLLSKKVVAITWIEVLSLLVRTAQFISFAVSNERLSANFKGTIAPVKLISSLTTPTRFFPYIKPDAYVA